MNTTKLVSTGMKATVFLLSVLAANSAIATEKYLKCTGTSESYDGAPKTKWEAEFIINRDKNTIRQVITGMAENSKYAPKALKIEEDETHIIYNPGQVIGLDLEDKDKILINKRTLELKGGIPFPEQRIRAKCEKIETQI